MGTSSTIPLGEFRSPVNSLGVGRNLGGTLGDKGMFCVLAKANGVLDLPIRAMHIRTMVRTVEHPKIIRMLSLGQIRANEWGFDDHSKMRSILFSNYLGDSLRRVGGFIVYSGLQMQLTKVVDCVFALCMKDQCGEDQFALAVQELGVDQKMVDSFAALHKLLKEIR
jgi:hypothetical protein